MITETSGPEEPPSDLGLPEFSQIVKKSLRDSFRHFQKLNKILITREDCKG